MAEPIVQYPLATLIRVVDVFINPKYIITIETQENQDVLVYLAHKAEPLRIGMEHVAHFLLEVNKSV